MGLIERLMMNTASRCCAQALKTTYKISYKVGPIQKY